MCTYPSNTIVLCSPPCYRSILIRVACAAPSSSPGCPPPPSTGVEQHAQHGGGSLHPDQPTPHHVLPAWTYAPAHPRHRQVSAAIPGSSGACGREQRGLREDQGDHF